MAAGWLMELGYDPAFFERAAEAGACRPAAAEPAPAQGKPGDGAAPAWLAGRKDDPDSRAAEAGAPSTFFCPIGLRIMRDPVMLSTGVTYDRESIEGWLGSASRPTCPCTGQVLALPPVLTPNRALRAAIEEWSERHAPWLLDETRSVLPVAEEDRLRVSSGAPLASVASLARTRSSARSASQQTSAAASPLYPQLYPYPPPPGTVASTPEVPHGAGGDAWSLAVRAQQQELDRVQSARRSQQQLGGGSAAGSRHGARPGVGGALPPYQQQSRRARRGVVAVSVFLGAVSVAYLTIFLVAMANNGWHLASMSVNPMVGPEPEALQGVGAQSVQLLQGAGQWWRLFSSPFVPAGIIPLVGNLLLLWAFGLHLARSLPAPAAAVPGVYLAGALLGALCSANLNVEYLTCGSSAGVCALMGGMWADALIQPRKACAQVLAVVELVLLTGIYVWLALMPLQDIWYIGGALLAGALSAAAALALPKLRGATARAAAGWAALLAACTLLLAAGLALAIAGVALGSSVGAGCSWCASASCVAPNDWWLCIPASDWVGDCGVAPASSGQYILACPGGTNLLIPAGEATTAVDSGQAAIEELCAQYCNGGSAPAGSSPPSRGAPAGSPSPRPTPSPLPAADSGSGKLLSVSGGGG